MKVRERSFFHFCQHLDINLDQIEGEMPTLKKLIQLEFKSAKNGIISINGLDYDHIFVSEALMKDDFVNNFRFEEVIYKISWINDFVNYGKFDFDHALFSNDNITFGLTRSFPKICDTQEFLDYISPKMAKSFNLISADLLRNNQFRQLEILFSHLKFVKNEDYNVAFRNLNIMLGESLIILKNLNKNNYKNNSDEMKRWFLPGATDFINCLPLRFCSFKLDFVMAFYNLINEIWLIDVRNSYKFSSLIIKVDGISENLWNKIQSNHLMLTSQIKQLEKDMKEIKKRDTDLIIWLVKILILIMIIGSIFK